MSKYNFSDLKIKNSGILTNEKWNGLVDSMNTLAQLTVPANIKGEIENGLVIKTEEVGVGINQTEGALRISTPYGFLDIGPKNEGWSHFNTDRKTFYFNKEIRVDSGKIGSHNQDLQLCVTGNPRMIVSDKALEVKGELNVSSGWVRVKGKKGLYFQDYGGGFHMIDNAWIRTYGGKNFYHKQGIMRIDGELQVGSHGERFLVKGRNVGIGTVRPNERLVVTGNVKCKVVKGMSVTGEAKLLTKKLKDDKGKVLNHEISFGFEVKKGTGRLSRNTYGYLNIYLDGKKAWSHKISRGTKIVTKPSGGEGGR